MKRNYLDLRTQKPNCIIDKLSPEMSTIWMQVITEGKDFGRAVQLRQGNIDHINFALSILEQLPASSLDAHPELRGRLERILKYVSKK